MLHRFLRPSSSTTTHSSLIAPVGISLSSSPVLFVNNKSSYYLTSSSILFSKKLTGWEFEKRSPKRVSHTTTNRHTSGGGGSSSVGVNKHGHISWKCSLCDFVNPAIIQFCNNLINFLISCSLFFKSNIM